MDTTIDLSQQIETLSYKLDQFNSAFDSNTNQYTQRVVDNINNIEYKSLDSFIKNGLVTKSNPLEFSDNTGKFLFSTKLYQQIIDAIAIISPIRQLADKDIITSSSLDIILQDGDFASGWVAHNARRDTTDAPKLVKKTIPLHEIYAQPQTTKRILDDSVIDLSKWIINRLIYTFAREEGIAFLRGDGAEKPTGILHYIDKLGTTTLHKNDTIVFEDVLELINSMDDTYLANATLLINRKTLSMLYGLQDKQGRFIWNPPISDAMPQTILGIPVVCCDQLPTITPEETIGEDKMNAVIGILADFRQAYKIIDGTRGITIMQDHITNPPFVKFYATNRVGGDVVDIKAIKLLMAKSH